MEKIRDNGKIIRFMLFCTLIYFVSYISRINLGAVTVELTNSGAYAKETVAASLTASFITYGIGQLLSGYMGDKFKPYNLIFSGFLLTAAVNFFVSFTPSPTFLIPLWAVNGFAHSLMWPPLVSLMVSFLTPEDYKSKCVIVCYGSSLGTIAVYLFAPIVLNIASVRYVFLIGSCAAFIMALSVKFVFTRVYKWERPVADKTSKANVGTQTKSGFTREMKIMLGIVMFVIVIQGFLRDGITTWMPSYVSETFNLGSAASILTGVILPLFAIVCNKIASIINEKKFDNEFFCTGAIFLPGFIATFLLALFATKNVALSVFLSAVAEGCAHGVNFMLTCIFPPFFAKSGKISFVSGLINSCTYVGSALSTYGIALFSNKFGWNGTIWLWAFLAFIGTFICFAAMKKWSGYKQQIG